MKIRIGNSLTGPEGKPDFKKVLARSIDIQLSSGDVIRLREDEEGLLTVTGQDTYIKVQPISMNRVDIEVHS